MIEDGSILGYPVEGTMELFKLGDISDDASILGNPVEDFVVHSEVLETEHSIDYSELSEVLEDDLWVLEYDSDEISAAAVPTVTASRGTTTSTSVVLNGNITNTGGATITARGFWIRKSTDTGFQEVLVSTTSNSFSTTITGLSPNTSYIARAIAKNSSAECLTPPQ